MNLPRTDNQLPLVSTATDVAITTVELSSANVLIQDVRGETYSKLSWQNIKALKELRTQVEPFTVDAVENILRNL